MVFSPRNKLIDDIDVKIHDVQMQRVYANKFLGVQIGAQVIWKTHIENPCKKFPTQRPVTRSFDVFFGLHLNIRMSKQFETPLCPWWRRCNMGEITHAALKE